MTADGKSGRSEIQSWSKVSLLSTPAFAEAMPGSAEMEIGPDEMLSDSG
jgi:hypothetical protein